MVEFAFLMKLLLFFKYLFTDFGCVGSLLQRAGFSLVVVRGLQSVRAQ